MPHDLDAVFFIQVPAHVELRAGLVHICYEIGRQARLEMVIPPAVFLKAVRRANQVADEFHAACAGVVPIKGKRR